ncbi:MAG: hypothetical protein ACREME_10265, partial [Gemmatimonadales bacterium]
MEAESFHITNPTSAAHAETPVRSRTGAAGALPRAGDRRRDTPVTIRLGLQRRAQGNLRRHLVRAVQRFAVLVIADLASFYVMRALLRSVREEAVLGAWVAERIGALLPGGMLNGWQFAAAIFVALFVTGNYGRGDQRRSPRLLFFAAALATALPLWMTIWTRGVEPVAIQYVLTTVLVWMGLAAERLTLDRVIARVTAPDRRTVPTLFVGPAEECLA